MNPADQPQPISYPDTWLRRLAVPFMVLTDFYILYGNYKLDFIHITSLVADTIQGYVVFEACRRIILRLDTRWPWVEKPLRRLGLQLLLTSAVALGIFGVLTQVVNVLLRLQTFTDARSFVYSLDLSDSLVILIWVGCVNSLYTILYLYELHRIRQLEKMEMPPVAEPPTGKGADAGASHLLVRMGKQELLLAPQQVLLFYIEQQAVLALTTTYKRHVLDASLDKLEAQLDPAHFFRANRQVLVTRAVIKSIRSEDNGKLRVELLDLPQLPSQDVVISRLKAAAFRRWLKASFPGTDISPPDL
ncbi:LytTR family transcriptional regulator DNA-binding domain-containing protein [Hymenobacter sp. BT664]|uniref:LytTR family transcriptional regulator DNA-binding domain-containing protein n=1 Tax=Hymenobacter montanus TaxID=2771359 RepID=A0A927BDM2_9BACT|nr:LytTR family DNA-binding domain-containing protein [Hymenobacter montanus]MBD2768892.1 LytTR family transcriptional regulator DNA-binding domain-containing protein [Hymenobacter montanus]